MVTDSIDREDDELDWMLSQHPYYDRNGFDAPVAKHLLEHLSETALAGRWNNSPTVRTLLTSIATHPEVRSNSFGSTDVNDLDVGALSGVLIDDPDLVAFTPDLELGPVPEWISRLSKDQQREYRFDRKLCVASSLFRQRWIAAQHRYDIHDAIRPPDEIDVVSGFDGRPVLHFWWD